MGFGIYEFYRWFQPGFRQKRTRLFLDTFHPNAHTRILDVGGLVKLWHNEVPIDHPRSVKQREATGKFFLNLACMHSFARGRTNFVVLPPPFMPSFSVWLSLVLMPWAGHLTHTIGGTAREVDYVPIYRKKS